MTIGTAFEICATGGSHGNAVWFRHRNPAGWKPAGSPNFFTENDKQLYEHGLECATSNLSAEMPSKQI